MYSNPIHKQNFFTDYIHQDTEEWIRFLYELASNQDPGAILSMPSTDDLSLVLNVSSRSDILTFRDCIKKFKSSLCTAYKDILDKVPSVFDFGKGLEYYLEEKKFPEDIDIPLAIIETIDAGYEFQGGVGAIDKDGNEYVDYDQERLYHLAKETLKGVNIEEYARIEKIPVYQEDLEKSTNELFNLCNALLIKIEKHLEFLPIIDTHQDIDFKSIAEVFIDIVKEGDIFKEKMSVKLLEACFSLSDDVKFTINDHKKGWLCTLFSFIAAETNDTFADPEVLKEWENAVLCKYGLMEYSQRHRHDWEKRYEKDTGRKNLKTFHEELVNCYTKIINQNVDSQEKL